MNMTDQPLGDASTDPPPGVSLARHKIQSLYYKEPDTKTEIQEVEETSRHRSKHQTFIYELTTSGKSLAEIQTAWHNYYLNLPDNEKHEVWQEFYAAHQHTSHYAKAKPKPHQQLVAAVAQVPARLPLDTAKEAGVKALQTMGELKQQLLKRFQHRTKLRIKHHIQSLAFGVGMGSLVLLILLFSFFNERFIAPFITPSHTVSATPIIVDPGSNAAGRDPKIIIPKINVEIPVVYGVNSIEEKDIDDGLEHGVVHYATTPSPGQKGNLVIVGHSSNNILNPGKFKFAFVLLSRLSTGDTFMLDKDGKRYVYQVYDKKIVNPTDVSVLGNTDKVATATLITCDPPGTSLHRLVVIGQQIAPDPVSDSASTAIKSNVQPKIVPGNSPSLWQRLTHWF